MLYYFREFRLEHNWMLWLYVVFNARDERGKKKNSVAILDLSNIMETIHTN